MAYVPKSIRKGLIFPLVLAEQIATIFQVCTCLVATGFKAAYFMGMGTLFAMAINVVAVVVCLFLLAHYLEGTLHKGVHLGGTCQHFNIFLSAESAHRDGTNHWQRILASTGRLGQQNKACWQRGEYDVEGP